MWGLAQDRVAVFNQEKTCALAEHWLMINVTGVPGEEPQEVPGLREDPGLASGNSKVSVLLAQGSQEGKQQEREKAK